MKLLQAKAFTLIELLVVITIIGILATGGIAVYTGQIQKTRDAVRIQDIEALKSAVEQFYGDNSVYPSNDETAQWFGGVTRYIPRLPIDPKTKESANSTALDYVYNVLDPSNNDSVSNQTYELSTGFENAGTVTARATDTKDKWNDNYRLEIGINMDKIDTVVGVQIRQTRSCTSGSVPTKWIWIAWPCWTPY